MDWLGVIGGGFGLIDDLWTSGDEQLAADSAKAKAEAEKARADADRAAAQAQVQAASLNAQGMRQMAIYGLVGVGVIVAGVIGYQMVKN